MKKGVLTVSLILLVVILSGCGIDITPGSCPNPLNLNSKGVIPVAIHGLSYRDVYDFDPDSAELMLDELTGVTAIPGTFLYADVSSPAVDEESCPGGPDGYLDLVVYFDTQELVAALGEVEDGEQVGLCLEAYNNQTEEIEILGCDEVIILKEGKD